jgi:DUF1016 N-terminal domain
MKKLPHSRLLINVKGYSERNLAYMLRFAQEYPDKSILQQAVAKLPFDRVGKRHRYTLMVC